jgi:hypothetical protein
VRTDPQPAAERLSGWRIAGRALLGALAGFFLLPLTVFAITLVFYAFDKRCGSPGDSGGCEMGIFSLIVASALPGAAIGFIVNLVRALRRGRRK